MIEETIKGVNSYILKIDDSYDNVLKMKHGSLEYYAAETAEHDKGVFPIVAEVISTDTKNLLDLKKGDKVVCMYFIYENKLEQGVYWASAQYMIARIVGDKMEMFHDRILVDKVEKEKTSSIILIEEEGYSNTECIVSHTSKGSILKEGQRIGMIEGSFYPFQIDGKEYYAVSEKTQVLFYYDENGKIKPTNYFLMIEGDDMMDNVTHRGVEMKRYKMVENTTKYPVGVIRNTHDRFNNYVLTKDLNSRIPRDGDNVYFIARGDRMIIENNKVYYFCNIGEYGEVKLILN